MEYRTLNPTTEETLETFPFAEETEIETALADSVTTFESGRRETFESRAERMRQAAEALEARSKELARIMATEMGKPLPEGEAEARKCAWACRYYADETEAMLCADPRPSDGSEAFLRYDPIGPVLAIMPWNFPFWQFFRFAAPALMAGNSVILKHAPGTPRCALTLEGLLRDAGFPPGAVQSLFLSNEQAAAVLGDDRVRGVTLTGSTRAGREVASIGGRHLKTMVMELGGSDPFIVLDDADVDEAARTGVIARCLNSGQSCIAAKRFLVHSSVFEAFSRALVEGMEARVVGDPTDPGVNVGPLARRDLRDTLASQVDASVGAGATVLCGGTVPERTGFFYTPTVLTDIAPGSPAAGEELFGPVAALIRFENDAEALRLANATAYGLGASVWTADRERADRFAASIDAGSVFVNGLVKSDPRLPFGGVKASGFGRELSREGILEFVNAKTVWIR